MRMALAGSVWSCGETQAKPAHPTATAKASEGRLGRRLTALLDRERVCESSGASIEAGSQRVVKIRRCQLLMPSELR